MERDAFHRKVKVLLAYARLGNKDVADYLCMHRSTFNEKLHNYMTKTEQEDTVKAIYDLAGHALAKDLKELETTIDYLDDQHKEAQQND